MYRKQALRLLALVDGAIKTIPQSKQTLRHRGAGRNNCRRQRKWLGERKRRGASGDRGKEEFHLFSEISFSFRSAFLQTQTRFFSPIPFLSLSLLPSSAWVLRLGLGKRRHGIFPQFYGSRPNPTPTHVLSLPPLPPSHVRREYWGKPSTLHCVFPTFVAAFVVLNSMLLWWQITEKNL